MPQASWNANPGGEYWIDVRLGSHPMQVLIDTGLIDVNGEVGFSADDSIYDAIKRSGGLRRYRKHARMMADGQIRVTESGLLDAQLISPQSQTPVGPIVRVRVYRGAAKPRWFGVLPSPQGLQGSLGFG